MRKALIPLLAVTALALGGCEIYFGDDHDDDYYEYCDASGCYWCDDWGCYPNGGPGVEPGAQCDTDYDCAQGCFCNASGVCEEGGFCNDDFDCPNGLECNQARSSCEPADSCNDNSDCPTGTFCDLGSGQCVSSDVCTANTDCPLGYQCDNGTCVPAPCTSDDQCMEGCYCDETAGVCEESGVCTSDTDCAGLPGTPYCDTDRGTCVPEDPTPGCQSDTDCPGQKCDLDSNVCVDLTCEDFDETACLGDATCEAVYVGRDCTNPNTGQSCTDGDSGCVCDRFEFFACTDGATPAP